MGLAGIASFEVAFRSLFADFRDAMREEIRSARAEAPVASPPSSRDLVVEDIAEDCKVTPPTVLRWIHSGRLVARRPGHRYLVRVADFERFKAQEAAPKRSDVDPDEHLALIMSRVAEKRSR